MTVTENDIINNASAIAALINGGNPTDVTIHDLDAVTSLSGSDELHCSVSAVDKKITKTNALKTSGATEDNFASFDADGLVQDSGVDAADFLEIADIDDTPADDADTAVSSKWIYDNLNDGPYLEVADIDDTPANDADTAVSSKWIYDNFQSYDTGWINRSDWTNVHMGSSTTKNADSNVAHSLDAPLSDLIIKVLISTDGTDNNSFEIPNVDSEVENATYTGITVFQVDADNITVQTGVGGLNYVDNATGSRQRLDTEDWYYKIKVYKLGF